MSYNLNSKVYIKNKKYYDKTVKECIDEQYYGMSKIIENHIDWYESDVICYLDEIQSSIISNKKQPTSPSKSKWMLRDNT